MKGDIFNPVNGGVYGNGPAVEEQVADAPSAPESALPVEEAAPAAETQPLSFDDYIREQSAGKFSSWNEVNEKLSAVDQAPKEIYKEVEFVNEDSKKIFELIRQGKTDEVVDTLLFQRTLASVDALEDKEALRLSMKFKNPGMSDSEIAEEINDMYSTSTPPEKPSEDDELTLEDYQKALKAYEKELAAYEKSQRAMNRDLKRKAAEAKDYLSSLKSDIKLPDLPAAEMAPIVPDIDPVEQERISKQMRDDFESTYNNLNTLRFKYEDEGVNIETTYDISQEYKDDLYARLEKEADVRDIFAKRYIKGDGSLDVAKMVEEIAFLESRENISKSIVRQALAQAKLSTVKDLKNVDLEKRPRETVQVSDAERFNQFASSVIGKF